MVPHSQIQMLGVPLGSDSFVSGFVENTLLGNLQETVDRLVEFEDTQSASYLLRVSYSIVRAVHFMRTTPLEQWKEQAGKFDSMIRKAIESILGIPMDDRTFSQACLTPKLGGLGLRRTAEHADLAFHASWHESMRTAKEAWPPPPGMSPQYVPQSEGKLRSRCTRLSKPDRHSPYTPRGAAPPPLRPASRQRFYHRRALRGGW